MVVFLIKKGIIAIFPPAQEQKDIIFRVKASPPYQWLFSGNNKIQNLRDYCGG